MPLTPKQLMPSYIQANIVLTRRINKYILGLMGDIFSDYMMLFFNVSCQGMSTNYSWKTLNKPGALVKRKEADTIGVQWCCESQSTGQISMCQGYIMPSMAATMPP